MFALDTNTLIYYFKGMGRVAARLSGCTPAEIGIPIVVVYELETGIAKSQQPRKRREQLDALLAAAKLLPFDRAAVRQGTTCARPWNQKVPRWGRWIASSPASRWRKEQPW